MTTPAASCGQHRRRKASEEGRGVREEREEAGGGVFFTFSRIGIGHPPRWFSADLQEIVAARGELLGCWGDSGEFLGL